MYLKKRLIFILHYQDGDFYLSRNFRLQKVGDLKWLKDNYNFKNASSYIDELIVLDVSRGEKDEATFLHTIKELSECCFIPIALGGGIDSKGKARRYFYEGADKIVLNTVALENSHVIQEIAEEFGDQSMVLSVDIKKTSDRYTVFVDHGRKEVDQDSQTWLSKLLNMNVGELLINSIDRDGTGQGYDMELLNLLPVDTSIPIIISGGAGHDRHLSEALNNSKVDAVATANLFNFVGNGLSKARKKIISDGHNLAQWKSEEMEFLQKKY